MSDKGQRRRGSSQLTVHPKQKRSERAIAISVATWVVATVVIPAGTVICYLFANARLTELLQQGQAFSLAVGAAFAALLIELFLDNDTNDAMDVARKLTICIVAFVSLALFLIDQDVDKSTGQVVTEFSDFKIWVSIAFFAITSILATLSVKKQAAAA